MLRFNLIYAALILTALVYALILSNNLALRDERSRRITADVELTHARATMMALRRPCEYQYIPLGCPP